MSTGTARRRGLGAIAGLIGAVAALHALPAQGQQAGAQRFSPAASEDGVLGTEGAERRKPLTPYVALWLNYALDPLVLKDADGNEVGSVIEHTLAADLVGSINVWEGLEVGLGLPVTLVQEGDALGAGAPGAQGFGLGDLTLRAGYRFQLAPRTSLALHLPVLLPTASDDDPAATGFGARPTAALQHTFERVDLLFNLSYLIRGDEQLADLEAGDELGLRAAVRGALDERWNTALLGEIGASTATGAFFDAAETPVEIRGGAEHWFDEHLRLTGFVGTGLSTGVGAPDLRIGVGLSFGQKPRRPVVEPLPGDRDGDGVRDENDTCPDDPEDRDGFADEDGCPDPDNDSDGLLDVDDACPNEPETPDGIADDDGCPDRIRVHETEITTFEHVRFRTGSDEILPASHPMLNEVASVMKANPAMRVRVEGHTDSKGDETYNQELSQRRAESVKQHIVGQGVDDGRLEAEGHGESRPIADNGTPQGRRKNRRVEFHILDREKQ